MFEELFVHRGSIENHRAAPLLEARLMYLRHLQDAGFSRKTLRRKAANLTRLVSLLDYRQGDKVTVSQIRAAAEEWDRPGILRYYQRPASPDTKATFVGDAIQWLRFLGWLEEPAKPERHPYTAEVAAFAAWAHEERGYSEGSIESQCASADHFFILLAKTDTPLASIGIADIDRAIAAKSARRRISQATIRGFVGHLRAFFRFAESQGWCRPGLAGAIVVPRIYVDENIPTLLTREDVTRLIATTEGDLPADKRDRAILMVLCVYGLRSGEVRGLQLDDLDWEKETLRVRRSKSGLTDLYPLSPAVGQALMRYILDVRPLRPDRTLFLTLSAPPRPLTKGALGLMVRKRFRRVGVVTGRRGPHALRHAVAQHLLDQGQSMKVIGDFLGHRSPNPTRIYAKVNLHALREVGNFDLEDVL